MPPNAVSGGNWWDNIRMRTRRRQYNRAPGISFMAMKVFVSACEDHERAWTNQRDSLVKLAGIAEPQRHTVVDAPADADIIIISDLRDEDRFASLRANPLVHRYPRRTFVYSDTD